MIFESKYNIGDTVYRITKESYISDKLVCPVCDGNTKLIVEGNNGEKFIIRCPNSCISGEILTRSFKYIVQKFTIHNISFYTLNQEPYYYVDEESNFSYPESSLFIDRGAALKKAEEMNKAGKNEEKNSIVFT